jgi:hypothetical protein
MDDGNRLDLRIALSVQVAQEDEEVARLIEGGRRGAEKPLVTALGQWRASESPVMKGIWFRSAT